MTQININDATLPEHVAFIPDGNRRWAKAHGLPTLEGHKKGYEAVINLSENAKNLGIKYLTVWFFSTENWTRTKNEVDYLMKLVLDKIDEEKRRLVKNQIRFTHLGRKDRMSPEILAKFNELEEVTKEFDQHFFNAAFDYGGREEMTTAIKNIINGKYSSQDITEELISTYLYTKDMPDPDLIIRTSGEKRLSGYLPWQGVYSELYFADVHCPDFDLDQFKQALYDYAGRERRRGGDSKNA
ncbi:di-trans,poly-cis-decaprenylcistransferase [Patescibacteria group bacterium]|nr:di-trans,poly-cis-decaprenylcistransferase [Patescibacteria group bacterium]MBU1970515.1 di-trans,poly-cis-decaprenylcistransferase [Patescibacteria group bacterium]